MSSTNYALFGQATVGLTQYHLGLPEGLVLLHLLGGSVYISITQLLIRRSLFDRIGLFETEWGSVGDFNWDMRAGLVANTLHVPHTWGGWRVHASQATAQVAFSSRQHEEKLDDMIRSGAIKDAKTIAVVLTYGQFHRGREAGR